jgi:very-short-patch-repair endonuclease
MAAVLACGPEALLSHRHALTLWEVRPASGGAINVMVPGRSGRPGPKGVRVHSCTTLCESDRGAVDGVPVTSLARTILDYASGASLHWVRSVLEGVERRGILFGRELRDVLARNPNHGGTRALNAAMGAIQGPAPWTQSELEDRFLALIRDAGLPEPETNVFVEGELVDAVWRDQKLVVEVDGYGFHRSREQFENDRRRDAKLQVAGYRVIRLTQERIDTEPWAVAAQLRQLLGL